MVLLSSTSRFVPPLAAYVPPFSKELGLLYIGPYFTVILAALAKLELDNIMVQATSKIGDPVSHRCRER